MSVVQHEATSIVHAGLADILHWLGETPIEPWEPRHAAEWETNELFDGRGRLILTDTYQVPWPR